MKWKIIFTLLFIASVIMMFMYIDKPLVVYTRTAIEDVYLPNGSYSTEPVTRTYQDNYASIGAGIGFAILAGASLICFALTIRSEKGKDV
ncbi:MAG: hypothetical protein QM764_01415 [Chitinophagaceae bacterium]